MENENRKYILVRTDGTYLLVQIPDNDFLSQAYKLLDCQLIETAPLMGNEILILDEEGKFSDKELNLFATALYRKLHGIDYIIGDVLIGCYVKSDIYGLIPDVVNKYVAALERCDYENKCS